MIMPLPRRAEAGADEVHEHREQADREADRPVADRPPACPPPPQHDNAAFVVRKGAAATTAEAMRNTPIVTACTGVNSQSYQYPASLKTLGGFKFNIVCGYPGSAEVMLAIHRGEADMFSGSWHVWRATQQAGLKDGSLIPAIQGGLKRTEELAHVPLMQELVDDPRKKKIIEFIAAGSAIGRALITPPGLPADRIAALRTAFDKLVQDPAFLADADKRTADIEAETGRRRAGLLGRHRQGAQGHRRGRGARPWRRRRTGGGKIVEFDSRDA